MLPGYAAGVPYVCAGGVEVAVAEPYGAAYGGATGGLVLGGGVSAGAAGARGVSGFAARTSVDHPLPFHQRKVPEAVAVGSGYQPGVGSLGGFVIARSGSVRNPNATQRHGLAVTRVIC